MLLYDILDELIINADHASFKSVTTDNIMMAAKGQNPISCTGSSDKKSITLTLWITGRNNPTFPIYF